MRIYSILIVLLSLYGAALGASFRTAFTYQGRLAESNAPANGTYDFEFYLYEAATGSNSLGAVTQEEVSVSNGLFNVMLDFGSNAFDGGARFLEMWVKRTESAGALVGLQPRVPLTPTPYALMAGNVVDGAITSGKIADGAVTAAKLAAGVIGAAQLNSNSVATMALADGAVTTPKIADAAVTGPKIAPGAIGPAHLAGGAVTASHLAPGAAAANLGARTAWDLCHPVRS